MPNCQVTIFVWTQTYREIFKFALVLKKAQKFIILQILNIFIFITPTRLFFLISAIYLKVNLISPYFFSRSRD